MRERPEATFEWPIDIGETGLTLSVQIDDGTGTLVYGPSTADIVELGTTGTYVATLDAPDTEGEYVLQASLDGSFDAETVVSEQLTVTANAPADAPTGDTYGTTTELARILKIRAPSAEQTAAMERVLLVATGEIDSEIDLSDDDEALGGWKLALATEVCLERAVEHWRQQEAPFGLVGLGAEMGSGFVSRDSWARHAMKLAPAKAQWGIA